jgi:glutathionylspermidine synthase
MRALKNAARAVWSIYEELRTILIRDDSHLVEFFSLSEIQRMLWYASAGRWHGLARADLFCTSDGNISVAELNSDTPSGFDEAYLLGLFAEERLPGLVNPNRDLPEAFVGVIRAALDRLVDYPVTPTVGLIYPTDIPEDMGMIVLFRRWLEKAGYRVVLGSPSNLAKNMRGRATVFGTEIDVLLRHYKTDWWGERRRVWKDDREYPDPLPLVRELGSIIEPILEGKLEVVNPFGAIVSQNKLSLAFFHERIDLFSVDAQRNIRRHIPFTRRLTGRDYASLEREKDDWVLKSDYGCEGAEVVIGRLVEAGVWKNALALAIPERWIAQRFFEAEVEHDGTTENYGVYLAGGNPCGVYLRVTQGLTTAASSIAPVMERPPLAEALAHDVAPAGKTMLPDLRVRHLLEAFTPGERWLPFRMPLLLYSAEKTNLIGSFLPAGPEMPTGAAALLGTMITSASSELRGSLIIVADLNGCESAALAAALSGVADAVIQIENVAHERELVPLRNTLGALVHFAPFIGGNHRRSRGDPSRPALFVLDRQRMMSPGHESRGFNNRHWAYLPPVASLGERGISSILYIHPENQAVESDDLNEDFFQYHRSVIRISYSSPGEIRAHASAGLAGFLERMAHTPERRETVFTYMHTGAGQSDGCTSAGMMDHR